MRIAPLKVSLFVIITLSILMIFSAQLIYKNFLNFLGAWNQSNRMSVYLKVDSTPEDQRSLIDIIRKNPLVSNVKIVDRREAGLTFQKSLGEFSTGLITEDEMIDLIPETLEVDVQPQLSLSEREQAFSEVAEKLKNQPQIDEISYSASWMKKFEMADRVLRSTGIFIFIILVASMSYLIALMIRAFIEESKQEIEVYSLLGATRWSIYRHFLKDIVVFLSLSLILAYAATYVFFVYMKGKLTDAGLSAVFSGHLQFFSFADSATVICILLLFIVGNSYLTVQTSVNKLNQLTNE